MSRQARQLLASILVAAVIVAVAVVAVTAKIGEPVAHATTVVVAVT